VLPAGVALGGLRRRMRPVARFPGVIEVEIAGMTVRIGHGADVKTVAAVLRALKVGT
jgi:transposase